MNYSIRLDIPRYESTWQGNCCSICASLNVARFSILNVFRKSKNNKHVCLMPLNMFYEKEVIFVNQRIFQNIYAHLYLLPKDPNENMPEGFCISINECCNSP